MLIWAWCIVAMQYDMAIDTPVQLAGAVVQR